MFASVSSGGFLLSRSLLVEGKEVLLKGCCVEASDISHSERESYIDSTLPSVYFTLKLISPAKVREGEVIYF
jgi:hypothetical protein